jgi:hypothetical protein
MKKAQKVFLDVTISKSVWQQLVRSDWLAVLADPVGSLAEDLIVRSKLGFYHR